MKDIEGHFGKAKSAGAGARKRRVRRIGIVFLNGFGEFTNKFIGHLQRGPNSLSSLDVCSSIESFVGVCCSLGTCTSSRGVRRVLSHNGHTPHVVPSRAVGPGRCSEIQRPGPKRKVANASMPSELLLLLPTKRRHMQTIIISSNRLRATPTRRPLRFSRLRELCPQWPMCSR